MTTQLTDARLEHPGNAETVPQSAPDRLLNWVDRHRLALLGGLLLLYLAAINGQWQPTPDSAEHAIVARHMVESGSLNQYPAYPDNADRLQPGLAWLLAGNFALFGTDTMWSAVVFMNLLSLAGLGLVYGWVRLSAGRPTAVLLTCLIGLNPNYFRYSLRVLTDLPFTVGLLALLLGYELYQRRTGWQWVVGLALLAGSMAVMALFRSVYLVAGLALALALVQEVVTGRRRRSAGVLLGLASGLMILIRWIDPRHTTPFSLTPDERTAFRLLVEDLPNTLWIAVVSPTHLPKLVTEGLPEAMLGTELPLVLGAIYTLLTIVLTACLARRHFLASAVGLGFVAQILLTRAALRRYLMPMAPIFLVAWWQGIAWAGRSIRAPWGARLFWAMMAIWLISGLACAAKFIVYQRQVPFYASYSDGKYHGMDSFGRRLAEQVPAHASVIIGCDVDYELGWFSDRQVYQVSRLKIHPELHGEVMRGEVYYLSPDTDSRSVTIRNTTLELGPPEASVRWPENEADTWWLYRVVSSPPPAETGDQKSPKVTRPLPSKNARSLGQVSWAGTSD